MYLLMCMTYMCNLRPYGCYVLCLVRMCICVRYRILGAHRILVYSLWVFRSSDFLCLSEMRFTETSKVDAGSVPLFHGSSSSIHPPLSSHSSLFIPSSSSIHLLPSQRTPLLEAPHRSSRLSINLHSTRTTDPQQSFPQIAFCFDFFPPFRSQVTAHMTSLLLRSSKVALFSSQLPPFLPSVSVLCASASRPLSPSFSSIHLCAFFPGLPRFSAISVALLCLCFTIYMRSVWLTQRSLKREDGMAEEMRHWSTHPFWTREDRVHIHSSLLPVGACLCVVYVRECLCRAVGFMGGCYLALVVM